MPIPLEATLFLDELLFIPYGPILRAHLLGFLLFFPTLVFREVYN